MASWTDISLSDLLPDEPWTSAKATAVYENPIAIAEGQADAPRIAAKTGGASGTTISFTGLTDGWKGCILHGHVNLNVVEPNTETFTVALSNDGVTYATATTVISATQSGGTQFTATVDFATGTIRVAHGRINTPTYFTATLAGAGSGVTAIRLAVTGGSVAAIVLPNGGESAS
jgi:hypothetical protein